MIAAEVIEELVVLAGGKSSRVLSYEAYPGGVTLVIDVISWMLQSNSKAFLTSELLSDLLNASIFPFVVTSMQFSVWSGGKRKEQTYVRTARILRLGSTLLSCFGCPRGEAIIARNAVVTHQTNLIFLLSMMADTDPSRQMYTPGSGAAEKPVWHRQLALECFVNYCLQADVGDQLVSFYVMCFGSEPPAPPTAVALEKEVVGVPASEVVAEGVEKVQDEAAEGGDAPSADAGAEAAPAAAPLTDNVAERMMMAVESNITFASGLKIKPEVVLKDVVVMRRTDPTHLLLGNLSPTPPKEVFSNDMCVNLAITCIISTTSAMARLCGLPDRPAALSYKLSNRELEGDAALIRENSNAVLHMLDNTMGSIRASLKGANGPVFSQKLMHTYELFVKVCCVTGANARRDQALFAMCEAAIPLSPPGAQIHDMPLCKMLIQLAFHMPAALGSGWTFVTCLLQRLDAALTAGGIPPEKRPGDKAQHAAWGAKLRRQVSGQNDAPAEGVAGEMEDLRKASALLLYETASMGDASLVDVLCGLRGASKECVERNEEDRTFEDTQKEVKFLVGATIDVAHYNMGNSGAWLEPTVLHLKFIAENPSKELREYAVKSLSKLIADAFTEVHDELKLLSAEEKKVRAPVLREQKRRLLTAYDTLYRSDFKDSKISVLEGLKVMAHPSFLPHFPIESARDGGPPVVCLSPMPCKGTSIPPAGRPLACSPVSHSNSFCLPAKHRSR